MRRNRDGCQTGGSLRGAVVGSDKCTIYAFDWTRVPSLALLPVKSISANDFRVQGTWGTSGNAVKTRVEHANASLAERERSFLRGGKTRVRRRFNDA